jgi:hypothetical protein
MKTTAMLILAGDETAGGGYLEIEEGGFYTVSLYSADGKQELILVGESEHLYRTRRIMGDGLDITTGGED